MNYATKIPYDPKKCEKEIKISYIVKPLYVVSRLLFVWPYKYGKFNEALPLSFLYKFVAYLICVGIAGQGSFRIYNQVVGLQRSFQIRDFLPVLYQICIQLAAIIYIIKAVNFDIKNDFFLVLDEIEQGGLHSNDLIAIRNKFLLYGLMQLIFLEAQNVYMVTRLSQGKALIFIVNFLSYYYSQRIMAVFSVQVTWKLQLLLAAMRKANAGISKTLLHMSEIGAGQMLNKLLRRHGQLSGLVKPINDMHGMPIVFVFCIVVILDLFSLYEFTVDGKNFELTCFLNEHASKLVNLLYFNGLLFMLVSASAKLKSEIKNTGIIIGNFLLEMETQQNSIFGCVWKKKLKKFLQQVYVRNSDVTGADIFVVDFAIISSVVGVITSYFIVILQFKE